MSKLNRLLVPVEFSPRCRGAVQYAEALSAHYHSEIVLLHVVIPPLANFSSFEAMAYASAGDLAREIAEQRTVELDKFPCKVPVDSSLRRVVLEGDPTDTIVDFASREKCNLIVMPTRGYGPFRRFLLGSVTAKVLRSLGVRQQDQSFPGPLLHSAKFRTEFGNDLLVVQHIIYEHEGKRGLS